LAAAAGLPAPNRTPELAAEVDEEEEEEEPDVV